MQALLQKTTSLISSIVQVKNIKISSSCFGVSLQQICYLSWYNSGADTRDDMCRYMETMLENESRSWTFLLTNSAANLLWYELESIHFVLITTKFVKFVRFSVLELLTDTSVRIPTYSVFLDSLLRYHIMQFSWVLKDGVVVRVI